MRSNGGPYAWKMELILNQAGVLLLSWMLVFCLPVLNEVQGLDCDPEDCQLDWIERYEDENAKVHVIDQENV